MTPPENRPLADGVCNLTGADMPPVEQSADPVDRDRSAVHRRVQPMVLTAVGVGGALGSAARYGVSQTIAVQANGFPWATFAVNVSGSFALGVVMALMLERFPPTRYVRPFIATGFLGGYTTYSTFAVETDLLIKNDHSLVAAAYVAASVVVGCLAVWVGLWVARLVPSSTRGARA
jgi:CrcB protein